MSSHHKSNKKYRIEQFFAIRQITGFSVSPDGTRIAYITNTNGLPNIWTIPIEGGWTSQITLAENAVKALSYSPKKDEIIFQSDVNGDENHQLYHVFGKGGEIKYLSPSHSGAQTFFTAWAKSARKVLFSSNKRDKRYFDTYVLDLDTMKEEMIYESKSIYIEVPSDWSENDKYIVYNIFYNNANQDICLYSKTNGSMKIITQHEGNMKNFHGSLNKKADTIYFLTDYKREFVGLAYYKIKTGHFGWLESEKWDITDFRISRREKYLLYNVNENGNSKLKLKNIKTDKTTVLKLPKGNCLAFEFTPDEKKIVLLYDEPQNPQDIYVYDLASKRLKQITFSMIGGIPKNDFNPPATVKYKSFDGLEIYSNLYIPKGLKKNRNNPAIVWPHGGPEWQEKNIFNKYFQILTTRGYIVIAPNFRGSTGYGKSFQQKIYKDWGGGEFRDVLCSVEYLKKTGYVDEKRISVVGGSFGGFMTLTCVTKAPDLWRCAVDIFGPANLFTFLDSIPEYWKPATLELVGDTGKDIELLRERSPVNFVDNIKCPIFVVQGANDPRVVKAESDQMVEKLRSQNKTVEYLVLEDEGHGFSKVSNQIRVWEKICDFLDRYMK
jgi:dipeptidyl aminopeptidase/acylaminoacyl peptidase